MTLTRPSECIAAGWWRMIFGPDAKGMIKRICFRLRQTLSWSRCAHPQSGEKTANQATSIRKVIFTGVSKAHVIERGVFFGFRQEWKEDKCAILIYTLYGMLTVQQQGAGVQSHFGKRGVAA